MKENHVLSSKMQTGDTVKRPVERVVLASKETDLVKKAEACAWGRYSLVVRSMYVGGSGKDG